LLENLSALKCPSVTRTDSAASSLWAETYSATKSDADLELFYRTTTNSSYSKRHHSTAVTLPQGFARYFTIIEMDPLRTDDLIILVSLPCN
jgi:hypothetical protein